MITPIDTPIAAASMLLLPRLLQVRLSQEGFNTS